MVDLMPGTKTLPEVMETSEEWIRSLGCLPLTVKKEILGFLLQQRLACDQETMSLYVGK